MTKTSKRNVRVTWDTAGSKTKGTVEEIVTSTTKVRGHTAEATKEQPQVLVGGDKSGKKAVHKPEELGKS